MLDTLSATRVTVTDPVSATLRPGSVDWSESDFPGPFQQIAVALDGDDRLTWFNVDKVQFEVVL